MSRIEQLIDEIEEYVEGCKPAPFSQSKIVVQKEQLYELLTELRLKTPDEIKRYQKIIAQKDKIISDAQAQAEQMIEETTNYANALVEEHEIMLKAYEKAEQTINAANAQAEEIIASANQNAEEMRMSALAYTQSLIGNIQQVVERSLDIARTNSEGLINGLSENLSILISNNDALVSQLNVTENDYHEAVSAGADDEEDTLTDDTGYEEEQPAGVYEQQEEVGDEEEEEIDDDEFDDDDYDDID
ncbi:MAG: ATPase [Coprococcus sp.]